MAKVQQKSEKISAFGGIFFVLDKFDSILSSVIDSHLGLLFGNTDKTTFFIDASVYASRPYGVRGRCLHTSNVKRF